MSYKGKITTVGTSEGIRFEKDLFKQHPEFKQAADVKADIIGRGKMLISVVDLEAESESDPVVSAFLSFLEGDMSKNPANIVPLNEATIARAKALTAGVSIDDDEIE